jgi:hypothetical protein
MGGFGSGRWVRSDAKVTTGSVVSIDVRCWRRDGLLRAGTAFDCAWNANGQQVGGMLVRVGPISVHLAYQFWRSDGSRVAMNYYVPLEWTPCHFGGERPWFRCPGCGRRCARLYGADQLFTCHRCQGLAYISQRQSSADRALRRAQSIRVKLGGTANVFEAFPDKPPWMRWRTYWRHRHEAQTAEAQSLKMLVRES